MYSIVETAKANNLNVFQYLYTVLLYMPDYKNEPAGIEKLLPWSNFIKERCCRLIDVENQTPEPHSPQHSWGIRLFIKEKDTKGAVGNTVDYSSFTVVVCSVFWNIDDFVTGVKFFSPAVSHFISDIFTIPIQLTIIKNVRLPAKARNHIHLHQGNMTEK